MFTDGGARGNPGPAATGVVLYTSDRSPLEIQNNPVITESIHHSLSTHLGDTTNNVAEWEAVVEGITWINENHPDAEIVGFLDSELVQRQIMGIYKVKDLKMKDLKNKFEKLIGNKKKNFFHIERAKNKLADALVNETLDAYNQ